MYEAAPAWEEFYRRLEAQARSFISPSTGSVDERYVERVACPVCGSEDYGLRAVKHGFSYAECRVCEFVYLNPQLTQQALAGIYNDEDVRSFYFEELLLPYVERDQQKEFHGRARRLRAFVRKKDARLLDVGCAAGNFLGIASRYGFRAEGLELNNRYVDYAQRHRGVTIQNKPLEEMNYAEESFDAVTLWDVIEHLPQPLKTLKELSRITAQGGVIGLTTINHACVNERILRERWRYYAPPDHVCSFTPKIMRSMLERSGFAVLEIQHHYMFEVLALDRWFSRKSGSSIVATAQKGMYVAASALMGKLFSILRSGDLITVYARKR